MRKTPQRRESRKVKRPKTPRWERHVEQKHPAKMLPRGTVPVHEERLGPCNSVMSPDFVRRGFYEDSPFTCRDCGKSQIWTAHQQRWWYEVAKGEQTTGASRCRECRRRVRARKATARKTHLEGVRQKMGMKGEFPVPVLLRAAAEGDDAEWLELARRILSRVLAIYLPEELRVIRMTKSFAAHHREKVIQLSKEIVLPVFASGDIQDETRWNYDAASQKWREAPGLQLYAPRIGDGASALPHPLVSMRGPATLYWWMGHQARPHPRATLMLYLVISASIKSWHATFGRHPEWYLEATKGISSAELGLLMRE